MLNAPIAVTAPGRPGRRSEYAMDAIAGGVIGSGGAISGGGDGGTGDDAASSTGGPGGNGVANGGGGGVSDMWQTPRATC
jgi:hypothetical protein